MVKRRLEPPADLNRNGKRVVDAGFEETGVILLTNVAEVLGVRDLSQVDLLDVGCGVRFTQTIVNRDIPIRSYTGVDVEPKVVKWLQKNVDDKRFRYALWDVKNDMYNKRGVPFTRDSRLPVDGQYDVISLFSVFTHMNPSDSDAMLHILRPHVRPKGHLLFSAFVDDAVPTFEDRKPDTPLRVATYGEGFMRGLVEKNGWRVVKSIPRQREKYVAHQFLCAPA
jgi:SAM-dependent methyltransferase